MHCQQRLQQQQQLPASGQMGQAVVVDVQRLQWRCVWGRPLCAACELLAAAAAPLCWSCCCCCCGCCAHWHELMMVT